MAIADLSDLPDDDAYRTLHPEDRALIEDFLTAELSHNTKGSTQNKRIHLRQFAAWMDRKGIDRLADVDPRTFNRYIADVIADAGSSTIIHHRYNATKTLYDWLENRGVDGIPDEFDIAKRITKNQRKAMRGNSRKAESVPFDFYLDSEQVGQLVEHVPAPKLRNQLIIRLMFGCGLRRGEVATIRRDRIDHDERKVMVDNLKAGTEQPPHRPVWYRREVETLLRAWIDGGDRAAVYNASESPYLFPTRTREHIRGQTINSVVKQAAENAGLQSTMYEDAAGNPRSKITAHTLRHSYAVHCVKEGIDILNLRDLMGHANISMTQQYLRFREEDRKQAAIRFGP